MIKFDDLRPGDLIIFDKVDDGDNVFIDLIVEIVGPSGNAKVQTITHAISTRCSAIERHPTGAYEGSLGYWYGRILVQHMDGSIFCG